MIEKSLRDTKGLINTAKGENAPDLFIKGAEILDVFSNSMFKGNIWVYKNWIAYIGEREPVVGADTRVIDAEGLTAVPGYIDAHGHADLFYNPSTFADYVVTKGATTVFSDGSDMICSIGLGGFEKVLRTADSFALKYLWGVPAAYPPYPEVEGGELFSFHDIWRFFSKYKECVSMSEVSPYSRILNNEDTILERILIARSLGKNVEGHTLGASFDKLNILVAAGITSCHESTREVDLRNRIRLGLYTMVRHSSIRSDFEELCPVINGLPKDSIMLVSDGIFAHDLCVKGYMDHVIREAIRFGIDAKDAIRMVTLNPARYFRLDGEIGSITPGRIADILLLEHIENPTPVCVVERGRVSAEKGILTAPGAPFPDVGNRYNPYSFKTVEASDFIIEWKGEEQIPVIDIVDRTVTKRLDISPYRDGSRLLPLRDKDIIKACYTRREKKLWGKGFVRGIGVNLGGMALTMAHETHGLLVIGYDDNDMALAANTVLAIDGGVVMVDRGEVLYRFPLPEGGTMSRLAIPALAEELKKVTALLNKRGSALTEPLLTIGFLTLTSIVALRLTVSGIYDVKAGGIIF